MLQLKNITKNYLSGDNEVQALKGIDIEFRENEFVSILGQSGCGKTPEAQRKRGRKGTQMIKNVHVVE